MISIPEKNFANDSIAELLCLEGKLALITGASGSIGQAISRQLAKAGAEIIMHSRHLSEELYDCSKQINLEGGKSQVLDGDFLNLNTLSKIMKSIKEDIGQLNILINNAADQSIKNFFDFTHKDVFHMTEVNLTAPIMLTKNFVKYHKPSKESPGAVVNIGSIEAFRGSPGHAHYSSTKAGLVQFTRASAEELAKNFTRINSVCPGLINRPGLKQQWPKGVKNWTQKVPLQTVGDPEDVANAVLFLCSRSAKFITGASITVDGGMDCIAGW